MRDLHQITTDRIVAQLKAGVVPWRRPWSQKIAVDQAGASILMPRNAVTDRPYSGINILLLWGRMDDGAFTDSRFLTFKQAKELGANVRKGEKGCEVVFVNFVEREDRANPDKVARIPFLKSYHVFNVAQCENLPVTIVDRKNPVDRKPVKQNERDATIDEFIASTRATIRHGEPRAFYRPAPHGDFVNMPIFDSFTSGHAYYAVLFHELGHWTGAEHRLNRTFGRRFGDKAYSAEELVAELASAFICAEFGIDNDLANSAAYIATWLKEFESNSHLLVAAASAASKAVEFMRSLATTETVDQAGEFAEAA